MQETRRCILQALWDEGAMGVEELAGRLGLSPMTVRHHLGVLEREGRIVSATETHDGRPGRPRLVFRLTPAGSETFPSNALQLADWLLDGMKVDGDRQPLSGALAHVAGQVAAEFAAAGASSVAQRLDQIVTFLNNKGYQSSWRIEEGASGACLIQTGPCPYRWIVHRHPELCEFDRILLAHLIGGIVERVPTEEPAGYRACVYRLVWPLASMPAAQDQNNSFPPQAANHSGG